MKKKIILILFFVLLLVGCNKEALKDLDGNKKDNFDVGETAVYKGVQYTVTDYMFDTEMDKLTDEEITVLEITYTVKNTTDEEIGFNSFSLLYEDDKEISGYSIDGDYSKLGNTIKANKSYTLKDKFTVSKKDSKFKYKLVISDEDSISMNVKLKNK